VSVDLPTRPPSRVEPNAAAPAPALTWATGALASRRILCLAGLLFVLAGVGLPNPVLVLCGLVLAASGLLMRWLPWDLAIPAAVAGLLAAATLVGLAGGFLGINLVARPWIVAAVLVSCSAAATFTAGRPGPSFVTRPAPAGGFAWAAYVPAALTALIGLAQAFSERLSASWGFAATDLSAHMIIVQDIQRSGLLDYSGSDYPRAFHMLAALVSVPGAPAIRSADLVGYDLRLVAASTWLSLALLLWTGTTFTLRLGAALRLPRLVAVGAAAAFGACALITNTFIVVFVYMGAAPSLLAVAVLWSLPVAALALRGRSNRVIVLPLLAAMAVMLLAHLWQTLIVVPPLALACYAAPRLPSASSLLRHPRRLGSPRRNLVVVTAALGMLAVGAIPVLSVQRAGGVALAATPGAIPPPPWLVLTLAPVAVGWLMWHCRRGWSRLYVGSLLGLLLATGLMLRGADQGLDVTQYYPLKVLWFLAIVLGPVLALCAVDLGWRVLGPLWRVLARSGQHGWVSRSALAACLALAAITLWLPAQLEHGSKAWRAVDPRSHTQQSEPRSTQVSAERYDIAMDYGTRYRPAVTVPVAVGLTRPSDSYGSYIVSKLISFRTGQAQSRGSSLASVCSDVEQAAGSADAVVITQMGAATLRTALQKQGCGDVRVVRIPGGLQNGATG
jgi:hypothetical protein